MGNIIIPPFAEEDIKNSVSYYQDKGIEKQFLIILDHSFQIISKNPLSFPAIRKEIRKFVIKDFPFSIYYFPEDENICILAVFHNKRNPKVWKTRHK
jgi:plasmid stabilization system protein ParE